MLGRCIAQLGRSANHARQGLGIMGRDHATGERDVGEVFAKGVEIRIR
jgi:hypothetical protein